MMKITKIRKKFPTWLLAVVVMLVALVFALVLPLFEKSSSTSGRVIINGVTFAVELAITPDQQRVGLMYRKELPDRHGMLFVFERETMQRFWMRNTYIPLDIIFIDGDGKVINIATMPPLTDQSCASERPARYVLEVPARSAQKYGVTPGMTCTIEMPSTRPAGPVEGRIGWDSGGLDELQGHLLLAIEDRLWPVDADDVTGEDFGRVVGVVGVLRLGQLQFYGFAHSDGNAEGQSDQGPAGRDVDTLTVVGSFRGLLQQTDGPIQFITPRLPAFFDSNHDLTFPL